MPSILQALSAHIATLLLLGFGVSLAATLQCYVCGPIQQGFEKTCDDFHLNATQFIRTCPEKFFGCSTHFEATSQRRQCERMRFNECKKVNGIDYCFCSSNLCNGILGAVITPHEQETDDEDILDEQPGSGDGRLPPAKEHQPFDKDVDVIIEDVGNPIDTIETKTSGANILNTFTTKIGVIVTFTFCLH